MNKELEQYMNHIGYTLIAIVGLANLALILMAIWGVIMKIFN
jgi:hypothetical protein